MTLQPREARERAAGKERRSTSAPERNWEENIAKQEVTRGTEKQAQKQRILPNVGRINYSAFFPFLFSNFDPFRRGLLSWHDLQTELGRLRDFLV